MPVGIHFQTAGAVARLLGSPQRVLSDAAEGAMRVAAVHMGVFAPDPVARRVVRMLGRDASVTVRLPDPQERRLRELCEAGGSTYTGWLSAETVRVASHCPASDGEVVARASPLGEPHALPAAIVLQAHLRMSGRIDDAVWHLVREGRLRAASGLTAGKIEEGRYRHAGSGGADPISLGEMAALRSLGVHDAVLRAAESWNRPVDLRAFLAEMLRSRHKPTWLPLPRPTSWGLAAALAAWMLRLADSAVPDPRVLAQMTLAAGLGTNSAIQAATTEQTRQRYVLADLLAELLRRQARWLLAELWDDHELFEIKHEVSQLLGGDT